MSPQDQFYIIEGLVVMNWVVVAVGLILLTVRDYLERHDEDRRFYRRHWRLIIFTYAALGTAFYLERSLRLLEHAVWNR